MLDYLKKKDDINQKIVRLDDLDKLISKAQVANENKETMMPDKIIKKIKPEIEKNMSELNEKEVIPKHSLLNDNLKKEKVQGEPRDHEASM